MVRKFKDSSWCPLNMGVNTDLVVILLFLFKLGAISSQTLQRFKIAKNGIFNTGSTITSTLYFQDTRIKK